jgi:protein-S-isoprenylcysteine O-methyltransferase Ste14
MRPKYIAYALLAFFLITEPLLRKGEEARGWQAGPADRGSTKFIGATFGFAFIAVLIAPLLNRLSIGHLRRKELAWGGVITMLAGIALRIWATQVLGAFYTRTLCTSEQQHLVTEGPYRVIRHPGYLADLLMWLGAGFATANWLVPLSLAIPMMGAYWYRIQVEEAMLSTTLQEYPAYTRRTWRLVPFLF